MGVYITKTNDMRKLAVDIEGKVIAFTNEDEAYLFLMDMGFPQSRISEVFTLLKTVAHPEIIVPDPRD